MNGMPKAIGKYLDKVRSDASFMNACLFGFIFLNYLHSENLLKHLKLHMNMQENKAAQKLLRSLDFKLILIVNCHSVLYHKRVKYVELEW